MRCIVQVLSGPAARRSLVRSPLATTSYLNNASMLGQRACYSSSTRASVEGRTVIVTGSARGIGKAIAIRLAADGYNVCINDIPANKKGCEETVSEIQGLGRKACVAIADVTKRDEVKQMVQTSVKELGPLNTMVANAGICHIKPILDVTEEEVQRLFSVNLLGVHNCYAEAAQQMIRQKETEEAKGTVASGARSSGSGWPDGQHRHPGKLIAAASVAGYRPLPLLGHYSATKFAVRGLTQAYALEMAKHGITANAFAPGIVGTKMWDEIDARIAEESGARRGDVIQRSVRDMTTLGRVSVPEDVAQLVSYLASSDSDYVTGQTQIVDGGIFFA